MVIQDRESEYKMRTYIYGYLILLSIISIQSAYSLINIVIGYNNLILIFLTQISFYLGVLTMLLSLYGYSKSIAEGYYNYSNNRKTLIELFITFYIICILLNSGLIIEGIKQLILSR